MAELSGGTIPASQITGLVEEIAYSFDEGGGVLTAGVKLPARRVPFACTINSVELFADQSGSCVLTIRKTTYSGFPGSLASIVASAPPTLSAVQKSTDSTLTGWTTSIAAGDVLEFGVTSATTVTKVTLSIKVTRT